MLLATVTISAEYTNQIVKPHQVMKHKHHQTFTDSQYTTTGMADETKQQ